MMSARPTLPLHRLARQVPLKQAMGMILAARRVGALPLAITLALSLSLAACQPAGTPPAEGQGTQAAAVPAEVARPSRQYGIEEFIESTGVSGASFNADLPAAQANVVVTFFSGNTYSTLMGPQLLGAGLMLDANPSSWQPLSVTGAVPGGAQELEVLAVRYPPHQPAS